MVAVTVVKFCFTWPFSTKAMLRTHGLELERLHVYLSLMFCLTAFEALGGSVLSRESEMEKDRKEGGWERDK